MNRAILIWLYIAAFLAGSAYAAEPTTKPEETGKEPLIQPQAQNAPLAFPEQMVSGNVTDSGGKPLGGVAIKLFADGKLVQVAHTTTAGAYEIRVPLDLEKDETVVLWFVSTTDPLMPQIILLKQSGASRSNGLFSPCTLKVKMRPQMRVDVKLLNENEVLASLKGRGCL